MKTNEKTETLTTWVEVDLAQLRKNLKALERMSKRPVMAVVKANAYGHGLIEIAQAAYAAGMGWAGVARLEEALTLRRGCYNGKILVLGYTPPEAAMLATLEEVSLCVFDLATAKAYDKQARAAGKTLSVHVKIDSGMGRLGLLPEEGKAFVKHLSGLKNLQVEGLFTHFARADEPELNTTGQQLERFHAVVNELEQIGLRPEWVHAANSGGTLGFKEAYYDMVRPGIAMYGLNPSDKALVPKSIKPILSWKTRLVSVKDLPEGHGIGYGHRHVLEKPAKVGVLAVGYADGFRRVSGNVVLIGGERVAVVGSVCMDQCMVRLDDMPNAKIGDEVVLLGSQGREAITADEIAVRWGTINNDVVATLAPRMPRVYLNG